VGPIGAESAKAPPTRAWASGPLIIDRWKRLPDQPYVILGKAMAVELTKLSQHGSCVSNDATPASGEAPR
jgi:hypothetical protein